MLLVILGSCVFGLTLPSISSPFTQLQQTAQNPSAGLVPTSPPAPKLTEPAVHHTARSPPVQHNLRKPILQHKLTVELYVRQQRLYAGNRILDDDGMFKVYKSDGGSIKFRSRKWWSLISTARRAPNQEELDMPGAGSIVRRTDKEKIWFEFRYASVPIPEPYRRVWGEQTQALPRQTDEDIRGEPSVFSRL